VTANSHRLDIKTHTLNRESGAIRSCRRPSRGTPNPAAIRGDANQVVGKSWGAYRHTRTGASSRAGKNITR